MPVGVSVRDDVQNALYALTKVSDFRSPRMNILILTEQLQMFESSSASLLQAFTYSAEALSLASRAFFNPGMLALLYFPAEHKYAVYTPLFASAIIPLAIAALREIVAWRRERKAPQLKSQCACTFGYSNVFTEALCVLRGNFVKVWPDQVRFRRPASPSAAMAQKILATSEHFHIMSDTMIGYNKKNILGAQRLTL